MLGIQDYNYYIAKKYVSASLIHMAPVIKMTWYLLVYWLVKISGWSSWVTPKLGHGKFAVLDVESVALNIPDERWCVVDTGQGYVSCTDAPCLKVGLCSWRNSSEVEDDTSWKAFNYEANWAPYNTVCCSRPVLSPGACRTDLEPWFIIRIPTV